MQRLQGRIDGLMTFGVWYHVAKSILDELVTTDFSLGQTTMKRAAIIQFRMTKCCVYCGSSFQIKTRSHATEVTNVRFY